MRNRGFEKHTTYFNVLEGFQNARECPFCTLAAKSSHKYLDALIYEKVNDPGIRKELKKAHGFCKRHAEELISLGGSLGIGIIYRDQLQRFMELLSVERVSRVETEKFLRELNSWNNHSGCPACKFERNAVERYIDAFVYFLNDRDMKEAFESSMGVCVGHFSLVLSKIEEPEKKRYFISVEREKMELLYGNVDEFIRKQDYRFENEPITPDEADSWTRIVRVMVGGSD